MIRTLSVHQPKDPRVLHAVFNLLDGANLQLFTFLGQHGLTHRQTIPDLAKEGCLIDRRHRQERISHGVELSAGKRSTVTVGCWPTPAIQRYGLALPTMPERHPESRIARTASSTRL